MKKTLIAAALLVGFAGTAQAQSVTLYGIVDMGYVYDKLDGSSATNKLDSGALGSSRFGLRGVEDLGNGLKANFQLESGFSADTGVQSTSGQLFNRQAWVGLSGGFGEVRLGRQDSLGFNWFRGAVNPFGNAYLLGQSNTVFNVDGVEDRFSNSIFYLSPKFSGFQGGVGYSFNTAGSETTGNDADNPAYSLGVRYDNGPILAVLTYEQQNGADNDPTQADIKNLQLGGAYDFGVVKLHAGYGQLRNAAYVSGAEKQNTYLLGVSVPFGASKIMATYQRVDNVNVNAGNEDKAIDGFAIGYNYSLSKRTTLYALFNQYSDIGVRVDNGRLADRRQFAVGVQHKF
ncbi:MAG: porin [Pigmentiphaga sp.]|uniref:porin n=1 Tax=Pigmentiphaga sp. TaxID=1977564 RepID=UPI0029B90D14|nr:porin [Pigmentiphaga sp.]MDX3904857.1 porin [Pigmentiphaga sp.]